MSKRYSIDESEEVEIKMQDIVDRLDEVPRFQMSQNVELNSQLIERNPANTVPSSSTKINQNDKLYADQGRLSKKQKDIISAKI